MLAAVFIFASAEGRAGICCEQCGACGFGNISCLTCLRWAKRAAGKSGCAEVKGTMLEIAAVLQREGYEIEKYTVAALMGLTALYANRIGLTKEAFLSLVGDMWDDAEETRTKVPPVHDQPS